MLLEEGGTRTRSGGLCIALCGPDHRVIGGSVGGVLTAAGTVQVMKSMHDISSNRSQNLVWLSYSFGSNPSLYIAPGDSGKLHVWRCIKEKQS